MNPGSDIKLAFLVAAVMRHRDLRGHDRCFEADNELYQAAGLEPIDPERPPLCEHRQQCDVYRASLFDVPVASEPYHQVCRIRALLAGLDLLALPGDRMDLLEQFIVGLRKILGDD